MNVLMFLIPIALVLGLAALFAFLWSLKSGQFDDMEGAANRILFDDDDMHVKPLTPPETPPQTAPDDDAKAP